MFQVFCLRSSDFRHFFFFFSSRRRHTRSLRDWSSDVCSSDLRGGDVALYDERDVLDEEPLCASGTLAAAVRRTGSFHRGDKALRFPGLDVFDGDAGFAIDAGWVDEEA